MKLIKTLGWFLRVSKPQCAGVTNNIPPDIFRTSVHNEIATKTEKPV